MAQSATTEDVLNHGKPALFVRLLGWGMLGVLCAFLLANVLDVWFGLGNIDELGAGGGTVAVVLYVVFALGAVALVLTTRHRALRQDARRIHRFNLFLIRACFWAVLLVGIADSLIAFARSEDLLTAFMTEDFARNFARASWLGMNVHTPLVILGIVLALFTRTLGFTWLALMIVGAELLIVISRFVFSYEQALMGDLVRYWYAALFLFASAYTLFDEGHVRVDVFYAGFRATTKGIVNAWGTILLGTTTCWVILWIGFDGATSIINAPVKNFEITQSGATGMYIKYQMAVFIGIFAITMLIQFVSYLFESVADWRDEPGHLDHTPAAH